MIKILIVDDERDTDFLIKQRYRHALKSQQVFFYFARNGRQALDILEKNSAIDILITDLNMPIMNGIELLNQLDDRFSTMKKFALSAYSDDENIQLAREAGAQDFITKPIDFINFEQKIGLKFLS